MGIVGGQLAGWGEAAGLDAAAPTFLLRCCVVSLSSDPEGPCRVTGSPVNSAWGVLAHRGPTVTSLTLVPPRGGSCPEAGHALGPIDTLRRRWGPWAPSGPCSVTQTQHVASPDPEEGVSRTCPHPLLPGHKQHCHPKHQTLVPPGPNSVPLPTNFALTLPACLCWSPLKSSVPACSGHPRPQLASCRERSGQSPASRAVARPRNCPT